jgi:DNA-binding response OmpR family regulator
MIAATERSLKFRPRLVLALADPAFRAAVERHLQMLGWEVRVAGSAAEIRRLAAALNPALIVLSADGREESGWLTCAKLRGENPTRTIVLVAPALTAEDHAFAAFVGAAAVVRQSDGIAALVDAMHGTALSAVG